MRLDEVPPDPGLLRFWGSRDEVEAQARSRRRRPRPRCGAGSGELRARFPDCESRAHPLFRRGCVTTISRSSCEAESDSGQWSVFSSKARAPGATFRESVAGTFVRDSPWGTGAPNLGFGSHLEPSVWSRRRAGAAD